MPRPALILSTCFALLTTPAWAETREDRLAVAQEYITMSVEDMDFDRLIKNMWKPVVDQAEAQGQSVTEEKKDAIHALYMDNMFAPFKALMLEQSALMADIYTLEEITAMRDFYNTPVGRSAMQKLPIVIERQQPQIMEMVVQKIPKMMPEIFSIIEGN